ncbi:GNAT family N-acetyltransferase [Mycobacterium branderi]|uniref:GNAT family N-acetyltransferase n=1 Tax=Mycobacterium branderi TaxID=43348 RepID=A0AA91RFX9_9MYCO|nr:GNAT family N-acetyltransferase [Mycobacterium branderi]ORA32609.1 GNAT family N-acetyltransferase [Mycobacterium branderi]
MTHSIRAYRATDFDDFVAVSRAADQLYADAGMVLPPDEPTVLTRQAERIFVAGDPLVGFVAVEWVDGNIHVAQLSVHPGHGRQGLGARLLQRAVDYAAERGVPALTLTTFRDVPWNGPWYRKRGFTDFPESQWGEQLRAIWAEEQAAGIAIAPRVAMHRPVDTCDG